MNKKKQIIGFTILCALILACQASGYTVTPTSLSPTATVTATVTAPTSTPTKTFTPTPTAFLALQDSPVTFAAGGFTMSPVRGYSKELSSYRAYLSSPDKKITILLQADPRPNGKLPAAIVKSYMEYFKNGIHDFSEGERQDVTIGSAEGISQDYAGTVSQEQLHGRVTVVFPEDSKILTIVIQATGEGRWDHEGELAYSATIKNLSFFKPKALTECPIAKNPGYGFDADTPIQIGGKESNGPDREEAYLSALLGPHGEIVSFYQPEAVEINGAILDKYLVSYKSTYKTLYMNIYKYDNPRIPFGFACSTTDALTPE